ncbi:MAG: hypothetical protein KDE19_16980 [Caldilineaceae bacterium]|nr:hypothetical protein [Caldilineaceae bacterium]
MTTNVDIEDPETVSAAYTALDRYFRAAAADAVVEYDLDQAAISLYADGELDEHDTFIFLPMISGE